MKLIIQCLLFLVLIGCSFQSFEENEQQNLGVNPIPLNKDSINLIKFYLANKGNELPSKSIGKVSSGSLENGKLFPFFGSNFSYFDTSSYYGNRAYTHHDVLQIILEAYAQLAQNIPSRHFYLMELSNKEGGKMFPHRTHQNGLSADFMMPKLKNGIAYYALDTLGKDHYWLDFNEDGVYSDDPKIKIDFNLIALHILLLQEKAKHIGYKIAKVIIKIEYKNHLFKTEFGKKLRESSIYIVKSLSPLINNLHDDHYHIDFEKK